MGMFDTFIFEDNRILECGTDTTDRGYQTKDLDSTLATYRIQPDNSVLQVDYRQPFILHGVCTVCDFIEGGVLAEWEFKFTDGNFVSSSMIPAKRKITEWEINFDHWNILSKKHDNRYGYFEASSKEIACNMARWKYGDTIGILTVMPWDGT